MNRSEYDREVYDHERMTGQHAEEEASGPETLATYTIKILVAELTEIETRYSLEDKRVLANLPAMMEAVEEDLTKLLPEGYTARVREWDSNE